MHIRSLQYTTTKHSTSTYTYVRSYIHMYIHTHISTVLDVQGYSVHNSLPNLHTYQFFTSDRSSCKGRLGTRIIPNTVLTTLLQPFLQQTLFHMRGWSMISFQLRHTDAQHNAHFRPAIENICKGRDKDILMRWDRTHCNARGSYTHFGWRFNR